MNSNSEQTAGNGGSRPEWVQAFRKDPGLMSVPTVESPFFESIVEGAELPQEVKDQARQLARHGYLVFDPQIENFEALADEITRSLDGTFPPDTRRIQEAWYTCDAVRQLAVAPKVLSTLELFYGRRPIPFQTLNFEVGTEQAVHSDMIHFYSSPKRFMAGVWIALEDIDENNGPLVYCPGSHRLPDYTMTELGEAPGLEGYERYSVFLDALIEEHQLEKEEVRLDRGQAILWMSNLLHGGAPIRDRSRTRRSQVTHYFFDDCLYYQPLGSEPLLGSVCLREVIDLTTGSLVPHRRRGETIDTENHEPMWRYPRPLPPFVRE